MFNNKKNIKIMANDCFVTRLKGVVNNDNLLKLGEMKMIAQSNYTRSVRIAPNTVAFTQNGVDVTRDAYGNVTLNVSKGDVFSLTPVNELTHLWILGPIKSNYIKANLTQLISHGDYSMTQDDINALSDCIGFGDVNFKAIKSGANINCLASIPIHTLDVETSNAKMDLKLFAAQNPTLAAFWDWGNTDRNPGTWAVDTRPSSYPIIAVYGDNALYWTKEAVEGFLKNMANCQEGNITANIKKIELRTTNGEPTGISDAVTAIKAKNYTVKINGVEL